MNDTNDDLAIYSKHIINITSRFYLTYYSVSSQ